jgi:branched-chain amino acid aminotransferase
VIERHIEAEELGRATEVFLTGTAAEVTPVGEIAEHRYTPGRISRLLMDAYSDAVRRPAQAVAA